MSHLTQQVTKLKNDSMKLKNQKRRLVNYYKKKTKSDLGMLDEQYDSLATKSQDQIQSLKSTIRIRNRFKRTKY